MTQALTKATREEKGTRSDTSPMASAKLYRQQRTEDLIIERGEIAGKVCDLALATLSGPRQLEAVQLRDDIAQLEKQIIEEIEALRSIDDSAANDYDRDPLNQAKDELSKLKEEYAGLVEIGTKQMDPRSVAKVRIYRRREDDINNELVGLHKPLVVYYTSQFKPHNDPHAAEDFVGAGMLGLMKAIKNYDPRYGATFASWAYQPIKREVLGAVRDHEYPNLSRGDFEQRDAIRKSIKVLRQMRPGHEPTDEEVADITGCRLAQVQRIRRAVAPLSLQTQLSNSNDSDSELGDFIKDTDPGVEDTVITSMSLEALERYGLACLNHRELYVLVRRFGLDGEPREKLQQIGRALGVSREAARQIEAKAKAKLNHPLVLQHLTPSGKKTVGR